MKTSKESRNRQGFWGCFGLCAFIIIIIELVLSVITLNPYLIALCVISILLITYYIGGKIKKLDKLYEKFQEEEKLIELKILEELKKLEEE